MEELSKDDQVDVRCMALSSLHEILPLVDDGTLVVHNYTLYPYDVLIRACVMLCSLMLQSFCHWLYSREN